ncbi:hypothetical protein ES703_39518 [subsurface metagenome]
MAKATHKPPSRIRYEQSHPSISFRLDRDTRDLLKQRLEDLGGSAADFIKESLGLQQAKFNDIKEIKQTAFEEGYREAIENCQIWYYCAVCGEQIEMSPNDDDHKAMIGYMKEHGWEHKSCHGQ